VRLERYHDAAEFGTHVLPLLLEHEAHNCVMLGVLSRLSASAPGRRDEPSPLLALLRAANGQVAATATRTGTYPLVVSPCPPETAAGFADRLFDAGESLSGVIGEVMTAEGFASAWARRKPYARRLGDRLGVYQLERLKAPRPAAGTFRQASFEEFAVLLPFAKDFYREIHETVTDPTDALDRALRERRLYVWCDHDGRIVSIAAWAGRTPNGARVNFVYTPPDQRGRGFASNCVAAVTRTLLESGRKRVFLFTDLANATSNRIYQALGYVHVGQQRGIFFDAPDTL
jgi:predicted GNAT family acetyltransferase